MKREKYQAHWRAARDAGSLLTCKHHPDGFDDPHCTYRSVLTHVMADNLDGFLDGGQYRIDLYAGPQGEICVLTPDPDSGYFVTASGVPAWSTTPVQACDRLVLVSGTLQGWHIYGEKDAVIQQGVVAGRLTLLDSI